MIAASSCNPPEVPGTPPAPGRNCFRWLMLCLGIAALFRIAVGLATGIVREADTEGYEEMAARLVIGSLAEDDGTRTPAYPLFLALTGSDPDTTRLVQMALGVCITGFLFLLSWWLIRSRLAACIAALTYALNLQQIWFESAMITETAATFLLVAGACASCAAVTRKSARTLMLLLAGVCFGILPMVRPLFSYAPLLFLLFCLVTTHARWVGLASAVIALVPLVAWSTYNYARFNYFCPTTFGGLALTNHTGAFMEYAPDKYRVIRDIYLAQRGRTHVHHHGYVRHAGDHRMVIFEIKEELFRATGKSLPGLSQALMPLNLELIRMRPLDYAASVAASWVDFWRGLGRYGNRWVETKTLPLVKPLWHLAKYVMNGFSALFLLGFVWTASRYLFQRESTHLICSLWWIGVTILAASVIQAVLESGGGARYGMPLQPLVSLAALVSAWDFADWLRSRRWIRVGSASAER